MGRLQAIGKRAWPWAVPLVALLMLVLMLVPAEVWHSPANDAVYQGFDSNLLYISEKGYPFPQRGMVEISPNSVKLTALPNSQPTVNLITTPLKGFTAAMDVRVLEGRPGTTPLRIGIWSARTQSGYFLDFGPLPENRITARALVKGGAAQTLVKGDVIKSETLGHYAPGRLYHLEIALDKGAGIITNRLSTPEIPPDGVSVLQSPHSVLAESWLTAKEAPDLFGSLRLSLTASASSSADALSTAVIENYTLTLAHQRWQVVKIDDPRATGLVIALLVLGGLLVALKAILWVRQRLKQRAGLGFTTCLAKELDRPITKSNKILVIGVGALVFIFLTLNALLFSLGNLPFDMIASKVWAYVSITSGPTELYHLPNVVSLAKVWGGGPYHEAVFPYHPVFAYLSTAIGEVYRLFLKGPGPSVMDTFQLEFVIKTFNILFVLADGLLIYLILRQMKVSLRWSLLGGGLFLFNPAVWFSTSVWGQTHVISVFFLLASIWLAETKRPQWAWLALAAGALTRPQMLVPGFLLGLLFFRKFSLKENIQGISWSIILVFLFLAPFSLAISPTLPVDLLANQVLVQEAGGNEPAMTSVSLDAYSIWPLVTHFVEGARGRNRFFLPSASPLIGEISYQRISQLLVLGVVLVVGGLLLFRRRSATKLDDYLPLIALGTTGFLVFKTGIAATHFLIGLPLLVLCRRSLDNLSYYSLIAIWTVTTLVPMYGTLGFSLTNVSYLAPALAPANNPVTQFFMNLYSADRFITLGSMANMIALGLLAVYAIHGVLVERSHGRAPIVLKPQVDPKDTPEHH